MVVILCLTKTVMHGQINNAVSIILSVQPPYSPYLSDYLALKDKVVITLVNRSSQTRRVYFRGLLTDDRSFTAQTKEDYMPSQFLTLLPNATLQVPADNNLYAFFNESNLDIDYGNYNIEQILLDGIIPDGNYRLCVDVYDYDNNAQLNLPNTGCKTLLIKYLNPPILISPSCSQNNVVKGNAVQNINFSWTPVFTGLRSNAIAYDFFLLKMNEGDNAQDIIESAMANNAMNLIKVQNLVQNQLNYNFQYPVLESGRYAWAVKARSISGNFPITNNGLSNVCEFTLELQQNYMIKMAQPDFLDCSCKTNLPDNLSNLPNNTLAEGSIVKTSHHDMVIKSITKVNGFYRGTGTIELPIINNSYVKVNVNFDGIDIQRKNETFYHTSGLIEAVVHEGAASLLPVADPFNPGNVNFTPAQAQGLSNYFSQTAGQLISNIKNYPNTFAYNLPIGLDENVLTVAISKMVFYPDQSAFDAVAILDIIDGNAKIGLTAANICIDKNDFCGQGRLFLNQDFTVPYIGLILKGGMGDDATSITFDKNGFNRLYIGAKYTFPAGTLVNAQSKSPAVFEVKGETEKGWNDWIAEVKYDPFHIADFSDFVFGSKDVPGRIYYDHSDYSNPPGIPAPYTSTDPNDMPINTQLMTWRGFYIPEIGLSLPAILSNIDGKNVVVKAENFIFDEGLSGHITINNILDITDGSLDGWYFSIGQFKLDIWKNTFKSSNLIGKLVLPLSKDPIERNQLDYSCTLTKPANQDLQYSFVIQPKRDIDFNIFWAKGVINESSNIQVNNTGGKFLAKATLYGKLTVESEIKPFPSVELAQISFQNLRFQSQAPYFSADQYNMTLFGLASPQHSIAGFTIDLDAKEGRGIRPLFTGDKIGIRFGALLKLVADVDFVPKAEISFDVFGKTGLEGIRPKWEGVGAEITKIGFGADARIGSIGIEGSIAYFNENDSYGFIGGLAMNIEGIAKVNAKAQFGYQKNGNYNYFFIDAMAELPTGINIAGTPAALYGFTGGVFYNMSLSAADSVSLTGANITSTKTFNPNRLEPGVSLSGVKYFPLKGKFSLKAGILFGLQSRDILDADGSLSVEIDGNTGGIGIVQILLNGRFINDSRKSLAERTAKCMGLLKIDMRMNFSEKTFIFHSNVKFGAPTHADTSAMGGTATMNFYAGKGSWFIHVGRPWTSGGDNVGNVSGGNPVNITMLNRFLFRGYFQAGSGTGDIIVDGAVMRGVPALDPMPPVPNYVYNMINSQAQNNNGYIDGSVTSFNLDRGSIAGGLAFGAYFKQSLPMTYLMFYCDISFLLGFDLAFVKTGGQKCNMNGQAIDVGVNGFYAKGRAYLGAKIDLGIRVDIPFVPKQNVSIVEAGVGAIVNFGAPNPTFFSGAIGGYFSVLGGAVKGRFGFKLFWGDECGEIAPPVSIPLIAALNPEAQFDENDYNKVIEVQEKQEIYVKPTVTFNFEVDKTFLIVISLRNGDGSYKREYRYYHILPEDVKIDVYPIKGKIQYQAKDIVRLNAQHFDLSNDNYSLIAKNNILFENDSKFRMEVSAKVKVFIHNDQVNISAAQYRNNPNLFQDAKRANNSVYADIRKITFETNCGIKYIEDIFVENVNPFHRTRNNPTSLSPKFQESELRQASQNPNFFYQPVYNIKNKWSSAIKNSMVSANVMNFDKNTLSLQLNASYLNDRYICLPNDFKDNFDFHIKVSTFDRNLSNNSFMTESYKVEPQLGNTLINLPIIGSLPAQSYVVVQLVLKKKKLSTYDYAYRAVDKNKSVDGEIKGLNSGESLSYKFDVRSKGIPIESKIGGGSAEFEIFRWYFTTGEYKTYQEKMAGLDIKVDTSTQIVNVQHWEGSQLRTERLRMNIAYYSFMGKEKFDFHDLEVHSLSQVFEKSNNNRLFEKKLNDGFLGHAFDNKSQQMVDDFLRTYCDDKSLLHQYDSWIKGYKINPMTVFMNNYITEKMMDLVNWKNVTITPPLPPLRKLPANLSDRIASVDLDLFRDKTRLFGIERRARLLDRQGGKTHVIPAHIITMKDVITTGKVKDPVLTYSLMADAMNDFNNNVLPKVTGGFQPTIFNNRKF